MVKQRSRQCLFALSPHQPGKAQGHHGVGMQAQFIAVGVLQRGAIAGKLLFRLVQCRRHPWQCPQFLACFPLDLFIARTEFLQGEILEFQQVIQEPILAHIGTDDQAEIGIALIDGGLGIHDIEGIGKQHHQKGGLDHQFIVPAVVAVIEYLKVAGLDEVAQRLDISAGVEVFRGVAGGLAVLVFGERGVPDAFHIEAPNDQIGDAQRQSSHGIAAVGDGEHPQVIHERGQKGLVPGCRQHVLHTETFCQLLDEEGFVGVEGLRNQFLAMGQTGDVFDAVAIHGQVVVQDIPRIGAFLLIVLEEVQGQSRVVEQGGVIAAVAEAVAVVEGAHHGQCLLHPGIGQIAFEPDLRQRLGDFVFVEATQIVVSGNQRDISGHVVSTADIAHDHGGDAGDEYAVDALSAAQGLDGLEDGFEDPFAVDQGRVAVLSLELRGEDLVGEVVVFVDE